MAATKVRISVYLYIEILSKCEHSQIKNLSKICNLKILTQGRSNTNIQKFGFQNYSNLATLKMVGSHKIFCINIIT